MQGVGWGLQRPGEKGMGRSLQMAKRGGGEGKRGEVCRGRQGAAGPQGKPFSAGERFRRPEAAGFGEAEPACGPPACGLQGEHLVYIYGGGRKNLRRRAEYLNGMLNLRPRQKSAQNPLIFLQK